MSITRGQIKIISAALIVATSAIWYHYSYRQNIALHYLYILLIPGWLFFLLPLEDKAPATGFDTTTHTLTLAYPKLLSFFLPLFFVCSATNLAAVYALAKNRNTSILKNEATAITYGIVTKRILYGMESNAPNADAVVRYEVYGQMIQASFKDEGRHYKLGQNIKIRYAVNYPEIAQAVDNK